MRRLFLGAAVLAAVISLGAPSVGAQESPPTVSIPGSSLEVGDALRIEGSDWPAGVLVSAVICGNDALDGSVDCDLSRTTTNAVAFDGTLRLEIEVGEPPQPCPCLLRVSDAGNEITVDVPIEIEGVDVEEPQSRFAPRGLAALEVVSVEIRGNGPILSWFGMAPHREMVVTVRNTGDEAVTGVLVQASWSAGDTTTRVAEAVEFPTVGTGSELDVSIDLEFDLLANGTYQAGGELLSEGDSIAFATVTQMRPWGLFGLLIAAFVAGLAWVLWRLVRSAWARRRSRIVEPITPSAPVPVVDPVDELPAAILAELDVELLTRLGSVTIKETSAGLERLVTTQVEAAVGAVAQRFDLSPDATKVLVERVSSELVAELDRSSAGE